MALNDNKITVYVDNVSDLSDTPNEDGLTADQLKAFFDSRGDNEIKESINGICDDLSAIADGASGADQVGATALTGGTATTTQGIMEELDGKIEAIPTDTATYTNKTFTYPKINEDVAVTSTSTELNVLDGIPPTLTATELGYVDGVTSAIQTQINGTVKTTGAQTISGVKTFSDDVHLGVDGILREDSNAFEIVGGTAGDTLRFFSGDLTFNADTVWTSGNDGLSSGMQAQYAGEANKLTTARKINGVSFDGTADIKFVGDCSTSADTQLKAVTLTNGITLVDNVLFGVKFINGNTASDIYLSVNSGTAKAVYVGENSVSTLLLRAGEIYLFVFNAILDKYEIVGYESQGNLVKLQDAGGYFTTDNAEGALQELAVLDAEKLPKVGGTMSGAIAMSANKITGLANPTDSTDAVNLQTLQSQLAALHNLDVIGSTSISAVAEDLDVNKMPTASGNAKSITAIETLIGAYAPVEKDSVFVTYLMAGVEEKYQFLYEYSGTAWTVATPTFSVTMANGATAGIVEGASGDAGDIVISSGIMTLKDASVLTTPLTGYEVAATAADIAATDTINEAFGKAQKQIDVIDTEIGTQTYTEQNYVTNGESTTASIDALDIQAKDTADIVSTNTAYLTKLQTYMGSFIEDFLPYGSSWNKASSPILTRTEFAEGMTAAIGVDGQVVTNDFDSLPIYREIHKVTDTLGNEFVRIPKFYIKKTDGVGSKTMQISKYKHDGFYLPMCFWDFTNSVELPYFDFGCYNASLNGTKLASLPNTYPLINKNIVDFRTYAKNNNVDGLLGYQQLDVHAIDVLRTLFFVEFGTLNAQAIMTGYTGGQYSATHVATVAETGVNRIIVANAFADLYKVGQAISIGTSLGGNQIFYGRTITAIDVYDASNKAITFDGATVNIAIGNVIYNTGWKSGFSSNITASSGVITANTDKYPCSYRGIENPFGSVYQFVDGVNIIDGQAWICDNPEQYASNVFASPYEKLSYVNGGTNGYISAMGFDSAQPFAEFPTAVGGGTTTYYSDYYYRDAGNRIALFVGTWGDGARAGLSFWNLSYSSAVASINIGGRLVRKAL